MIHTFYVCDECKQKFESNKPIVLTGREFKRKW